jgi:hypothetical protein
MKFFRDRYAPSVPIIGHCYDFPIPNGVHPVCAGPWLKPSLDYCGCTDLATAICRDALVAFRVLLNSLAGDPKNNFTLINTQGQLASSDWANELHPTPNGFRTIAQTVVTALRTRFPGRI